MDENHDMAHPTTISPILAAPGSPFLVCRHRAVPAALRRPPRSAFKASLIAATDARPRTGVCRSPAARARQGVANLLAGPGRLGPADPKSTGSFRPGWRPARSNGRTRHRLPAGPLSTRYDGDKLLLTTVLVRRNLQPGTPVTLNGQRRSGGVQGRVHSGQRGRLH